MTDTTIEEMVSKASPPRDPLDALDRLLLRIHASMADPLEFVVVPKTWYSVVYGKDDADLDQYIGLLTQLNLIEGGSLRRYRPTLEGWQRLRELRADTRNSNQAFVAMWFTPEMMTAWREGFEPALRAVGFDPIRIDLIQHNEKIDDRIIAEIRRSGLLVADFTGGRGGVYFEAGFALGLGRPVIWTCREDWVDKLHFDTRQYNHITWAEPRELRETLQARIEATVPGRARTIT